MASTSSAQKIIRVTPQGGNQIPKDGSTWAKAIAGNLLQQYINTAGNEYTPGNNATKTEFWIKTGTYTPQLMR